LASVEKELQHAKKENATLAYYINARRKKEGWRKEETRKKEEARKKAEEDQSSKDVQTWRKYASKGGPKAPPFSC
jgi:hypothetical protein